MLPCLSRKLQQRSRLAWVFWRYDLSEQDIHRTYVGRNVRFILELWRMYVNFLEIR